MSDRIAGALGGSVVWAVLGSLLLVGLRGALAQEVVYTNDFEAPIGEEWFGAPSREAPRSELHR